MAHAARVHAHEHLAGGRGFEVQLSDLERSPDPLEHRRTDLQRPSSVAVSAAGSSAAGSSAASPVLRSGGAVF